ncbi:hypothetical protein [Parabacteroides sp. Marseille-P3160]|uniref:hypothetical protein n=1 Tax=Parabacteroides sp. Marseille-P3160 TaxID=1917887 RepID=UPI0009B9E6A7|nr:hypothetical protein [Parabacteroides sp. Marseille-P3160]
MSESASSLKRIRLAVFINYFYLGLCFSSLASQIPYIKTALKLDNTTWRAVLLMLPLGQICEMFISDFVISKLGSKFILPIALARIPFESFQKRS